MPLPSDAADLLHDLGPVLDRWGRWCLFGAQAVVVHGVPRLTADVDVTLALHPLEPDRFASDMNAAGFALRIDDPDFVRRTRVMPFTHRSTGMPLDVVLASAGLEDEFLARATPRELGGQLVPVIDVGDLVIVKILAGRPKDLEDVRSLWRLHEQRINTSRVRAILAQLEEALGQSDLLPTLDAVVHRRR